VLGKSCQYSENDHLEILNTYLDGKSFQFTALEHAFVMQAQMMDVSVVGHAWLIPAHSICLPHALPFEMSHVYVMKFAFLVPAVMGQCICNIDTNYPCADDEVSIYKTTLIQATLPTHQSVRNHVFIRNLLTSGLDSGSSWLDGVNGILMQQEPDLPKQDYWNRRAIASLANTLITVVEPVPTPLLSSMLLLQL
jgi:hypothetical protein